MRARPSFAAKFKSRRQPQQVWPYDRAVSEMETPDLSALGVSGTATGAGALALYWTLGPSLKAVGNVFGEWTEYRLRNLLGLGEKISKRLPDESEPDGQGIHPRAAKVLLEEASWINDDLHQEYLAGLFISSRSPDGVSDDGVYYARIIAGLTASQIRMHYGIYSAYNGTATEANLRYRFNGGEEALWNLSVLATREAYFSLAAGEPTTDTSAFAAATHGLEREGLVTQIAPPIGAMNKSHVVAVPSLLGAVVYHRAMGYNTQGIDTIRSDRAQLARIDPGYSFADLHPEPHGLEGAIVGPA